VILVSTHTSHGLSSEFSNLDFFHFLNVAKICMFKLYIVKKSKKDDLESKKFHFTSEKILTTIII
jgi:hypothetical protein